MESDDATLVRKVLDGDVDAFRPLADRYGQRVAGLCLGMLGHKGPVDDVVQESFLKAWRNLRALVDPAKFGSWLFGIARNQCLDTLRKRQRSREQTASSGALQARPDSREPGQHRMLEQAESASQIREAVASLPDKYRQVIELRYYALANYTEIADALDLSFAGVNQRLTRARARLRQSMARVGLTQHSLSDEADV